MHTKYHTEAFVVRSFERKEADRMFVLITKNFGKLFAYAQGVRKIQSKHRFGLHELSKIEVSFVRGKAGVRIVHVISLTNVYRELAPYPKNLQVFQNILGLADRLMPGEELVERVYPHIEAMLRILSTEYDPHRVSAIEVSTALGILHSLGYVQEKSPFGDILAGTIAMESGHLDMVYEKREYIVREINRALSASQL
jgi:recombinational DNA repair protein (RecF pathway)